MKEIILLFIFIALLPFTPFPEKHKNKYDTTSRKQNTLLKCNIMVGASNGMSYTDYIKQDKVFIVIYTVDDVVYLANFWSISKSQSFGVLTPTEPKSLKHLVDRKGSTIEIFNWKFDNTYDDESGKAKVTFIKKGIDVIVLIETEKEVSLSLAGKIE